MSGIKSSSLRLEITGIYNFPKSFSWNWKFLLQDRDAQYESHSFEEWSSLCNITAGPQHNCCRWEIWFATRFWVFAFDKNMRIRKCKEVQHQQTSLNSSFIGWGMKTWKSIFILTTTTHLSIYDKLIKAFYPTQDHCFIL